MFYSVRDITILEYDEPVREHVVEIRKKPRDDERQRCEVWTRVMGYHRPVASFNTGKKGEFAERVYFEERRALPA